MPLRNPPEISSTAAAADGDFDFLGRAVELAAGLHHRDHIAVFAIFNRLATFGMVPAGIL